ncbi:RNA polymerase sigma factor [Roseateles sp. DAIF2]|uniref:RNA polymerase sigma factor n=1 Tax=Roseateles sp. DAIF2 TaxID=2714952 RepID=UPI0018A24F31|nr:RNA polymerase sigma factor [Roseateles sp. DAIF2]QPF71681.1 RNA polymerase sigma factor [Roseateles sp. DAIF2]
MQEDLGAALVAALPRLRRYALALSRSGDIADDLVQGACERALAARGPADAETPLLAWLFTIIRNLWLDRLRRKQTEGVQTDIDEQAELLSGAGSEDERVDARRRLEKVQRALERLPGEQRELMLLICVEELSYKEAAAVTGVPIGTVMSRLARARVRLAELAGLSGAAAAASAA